DRASPGRRLADPLPAARQLPQSAIAVVDGEHERVGLDRRAVAGTVDGGDAELVRATGVAAEVDAREDGVVLDRAPLAGGGAGLRAVGDLAHVDRVVGDAGTVAIARLPRHQDGAGLAALAGE